MEENELLTRTGPGTPMGRYFRHFWQPVALAREIAEPDGAPLRVMVLGEALVLFRDSEGRLGLLDRHCPHRGADLFFGRNEECGLRCVYHGWKFDVTGKAVDLPNVPSGVRHHDTVRVTAYPTREYGEIIWAWLGPDAENLPDVPQLEFGVVPPDGRFVSKQLMECNWAQAMEGDLDASHFSFLHMPAPSVPSNENPDATTDEKRLAWIRNDPMPKFQIREHEAGFVVGAARAGDPDETYWRMTQFLLPAHGTAPTARPGETYFGFTLAPITDTSCWMYCYAWNPDRPLGEAERRKMAEQGHGVIAQVGPDFVPLRNRSNDYGIDRAQQRDVSFTGIQGLAEQDIMIQQSQGEIADRTRETLTATDAAIVRFRRTMMDGARRLAETGEGPAAARRPAAYRTRPGSWTAAEGIPFEDVMRERFGDADGWVAG